MLTASTQASVSCAIKDLRMTTSPGPQVSRRAVLAGAAAVGGVAAIGATLAACGSDPEPAAEGPTAPATVNAADVPVGGGTVVTGAQVVVTQPTAGEFKAFSAVCTHQGCVVARVQDGAIECPCHGSRFSATDGSVLTGPATRTLPSKQVTVSGDSLTIA
jgi:Rieske Fe-S protein